MLLLQTICIAFAMFSAIPTPQFPWNEKNMAYPLCAFPLIGIVCLFGWGIWAELSRLLAFPALLQGAGLCLIPVFITGGIHLDGLADTADALASYGDGEKRQQILKDPHSGAFAIIRLCTYFVAYFALCCSLALNRQALLLMGLAFLLERSLSGLSIASFPLARDSGLAHTFSSGAHKKQVRCILLTYVVIIGVAMVLLGTWVGGVMVLVALLVFLRYFFLCRNAFGGLSGDLAGWFLQWAELWMLFALVLCQGIGEKLL